ARRPPLSRLSRLLAMPPTIYSCRWGMQATSPPTGRASASARRKDWRSTFPAWPARRPTAPRPSSTAIPSTNRRRLPRRFASATQPRGRATTARDESGGMIAAVSDTEIISAQVRLASSEGLFCEPASAAPLALLNRLVKEGRIEKDATVVVVLTGSGLKDPDAALKNVEPPI